MEKYIKWMVIIPPFLFVAISTFQLDKLNDQILSIKTFSIKSTIEPIFSADSSYNKIVDKHKLAELLLLAQLEADVINRRYHQANVSMMLTLWIKYLSFLTGIILTMVGSIFILGRINDLNTTVNYDTPNFGKIAFQSSSPGIILSLIGMVLILASFQSKSIGEIQDTAIYVGKRNSSVEEIKNEKLLITPNEVQKDAGLKDTNKPSRLKF
ncbi:hypothetical protein TH61_16280 [Rufibacter sp. DG15C]|uniref:hypothetical protein n=1 Tax=Rufibacter sp. DG15C TaxID=1379909 RepID=UPI00078D8592|nr:hypothetical protein [Rufibacter sp. DG15C]AMM52434.1 hypothetical protein TH61_16280 [Rufibacter sp. DG15C]